MDEQPTHTSDDPPKRDESPEPAGSKKSAGLSPDLMGFAGMGISFIGCIAGGLLLGWLVDHFAGTYPTGSVVGVVVGLIVGAYSFIRDAMRASRAARREYERAHPRSQQPRNPRHDC